MKLTSKTERCIMAIDVNAANWQANQLASYATRLQSAKNQLTQYKCSISSEWQGQEVKYILQGIEKAIAEINSIVRELNTLSSDVKNTANTIRKEEEAAARAWAEKQRRIQVAQEKYVAAEREVEELTKKMNSLSETLRSTKSQSKKKKLLEELEKLEKQLAEKRNNRDVCYNNLMWAKR